VSTEPNPTPCRECNSRGFTINRADHAKHLKSDAWRKAKGPTHQFEQMLVAPDPQVLAECGGCHYLGKSEFMPVVDIFSAQNELKAQGWRLIDGVWKCAQCVEKHKRAQDKKKEREKLRNAKELALRGGSR